MGVLYVRNGSTWEPINVGLPAGGQLGQVLGKNSNLDGDVGWKSVLGGNVINNSTVLGANYTVTTTAATPSGFTTTVALPAAGPVLITAAVDANGSATGFGRIQAIMRVNSGNLTPSLLYDSNGALFRLIWGMSWVVNVGAGNNTFDMQFVKNGSTGTLVVNATNTAFSLLGL